MNELTPRESYPARVARVTAGLSAAGAIAGAGVGLMMTLVTGGFHASSVAQVLLSAGAVGAACGAVLFPLGTWALMRRVPLGRALFRTLVPSAVGAALALGFLGLTAPVGILGATAGFTLSALWLRRSAPDGGPLASGA